MHTEFNQTCKSSREVTFVHCAIFSSKIIDGLSCFFPINSLLLLAYAKFCLFRNSDRSILCFFFILTQVLSNKNDFILNVAYKLCKSAKLSPRNRSSTWDMSSQTDKPTVHTPVVKLEWQDITEFIPKFMSAASTIFKNRQWHQ